MMYLLINSKYQISHRCFISWRCIFKTSQFFRYSIARFTIRFYVIFEINRLFNFDSFVFANFASMYNLTLQNLRHWENLLESFKQYIAKKITSLKKFQDTHRWKSLHENFKLNSLKYRAENTNDCCEKMLKIQFSRMCCSQNSIDIIWRKQN